MAFKMNKPIIKGTKKHSALLAKASGTVDPTLGTAASMYGQSMNPDVIDYNIKQTKIEWDKKKKKKEEPEKEEISLEKEEIKEDDIDYDALFAPEEDDPDLTLNERKKETAKRDKDVAIEKLELQILKQLSVDKLSDKPIEAKKREREEFPKPPYEGGTQTVQSVGDVSTQNLKTSYTKEEQSRLIFSEKHGRMVLPEEVGKKPDVIIESKKLDKELAKATTKSQEKTEENIEKRKEITTKPTKKRNANKDREYKNASTYIQAQMRRRDPKYPWPKLK